MSTTAGASVFYTTNPMGSYTLFPESEDLPATPDINAYTNTSVTNTPILLYRIDVMKE